jgi:Xaa-Pro aminopeptidase
MTRFHRLAAAALAAGALGFAAPAFAEGASYPRIVGSGENASVEYGPDNARNIVGGGAVVARDVAGGGAMCAISTNASSSRPAPACAP